MKYFVSTGLIGDASLVSSLIFATRKLMIIVYLLRAAAFKYTKQVCPNVIGKGVPLSMLLARETLVNVVESCEGTHLFTTPLNTRSIRIIKVNIF